MDRWLNYIMLAAGIWLNITSCTSHEDHVIRIAVASSLRVPMEEISSTYQKDHPELPSIEIISGASGMLTRQIQSGAPYDAFLAAHPVYSQQIYEWELGTRPDTFLIGECVMWSRDTTDQTLESKLLAARKIALPKPKVAPYGAFAKKWMEEAGIWDKVAHKIIYAASVSQSNQFIQAGSVEVAFTSASAMPLIPKGKFRSFPHQRSSIYHTLSLLGTPPHKDINNVLLYLQSEPSRMLFHEYGFQLVHSPLQSASR